MEKKRNGGVTCAALSLVLRMGVFVLLVLLSSCTRSSSQRPLITLRLSHVFSPKEELAVSMEKVAARINAETEGRVRVLTFPSGQIATYKDGVELVVRGAYFISVEDPSYIGDYVPEFTALVGPMLYRNYDEYLELIQTPLVQGWVKKIEQKGIKILSLKYLFGFRNMITDRLVQRPSDLNGLKIRTPGSQLFIKTINAMGAVATPLPWGETFSALQQGVVDGLEGSEFTNMGTKVYETGKNRVALTNHFLGTCGAYISTDVWKKIPPPLQLKIENIFETEANTMIAELKAKHSQVVEQLKAKGVQFNKVKRVPFEKAVAGTFSSLKGVDDSIYNAIQVELKKIRQKQKRAE